jgi:plasmid maintenance system antidote protein VapI
MAYLAYCRIGKVYALAIKTVKVHESKRAMATESPGEFIPVLQAPRRLRYAAVDVLPELVAGLSAQVEEVAEAMARRCAVAESLAQRLEEMAGPSAGSQVQMQVQQQVQQATSHARPTMPYLSETELRMRRPSGR